MKRPRCFTLDVDGAEVRVQGDPKMDPVALEALKSVVRAGMNYLQRLDEERVFPQSVELTEAQADALIRISVEKQVYPLRRTKLSTWTTLCNAGLVRCVNHDRSISPGTLLEITEQGRIRALHERVQKNARKRETRK